MKTLQSVRIKPNPAGKDRTRSGANATQLGAEWVDVKNVGSYDVDLTGVSLYHRAYEPDGYSWKWALVMSFRGTLRPGQVLRVHSGSGPESALNSEDRIGAEFHWFTNRDRYTWNNDRSDCAALWESGASSALDQACYDAPPPEGVVLVRVGSQFVPSR
ncbi:MAG: lamin tail domain-containing protein [Planctomycetes bacterium]|nr:lamin tail domain-containing protein [Planctomycetota bacterium]